MKLVDYKKADGVDSGFWDDIDKQLAERRERSLTIALPNRASFSS
jgi:hypothetical protein